MKARSSSSSSAFWDLGFLRGCIESGVLSLVSGRDERRRKELSVSAIEAIEISITAALSLSSLSLFRSALARRGHSMRTDLGLSSVLSRHCATVLVLGGRRVGEEEAEEKKEGFVRRRKKNSRLFKPISQIFFFSLFSSSPSRVPCFLRIVQAACYRERETISTLLAKTQ